MTAQTESHGRFDRRLIGLVLVLLGGALLWLAIDQRETLHGLWRGEPTLVVELGGLYHRMPAADALALEKVSQEQLSASQPRLQRDMTQLVEEELDRIFTDIHAQVPTFADWYFSLSGEYSRMTFWLLDRAGMVDRDVVLERLQQQLFDDTEYAARLQRLNRAGAMAMKSHQQQLRGDWIEQVMERVSGRALAPESISQTDFRLSLEEVLPALDQRSGPDFESRLAVSATAASGAGATAVTMRLLGRRALGAAGGSLRMRGLTRGAARAGAATGAGTMVCSPSVVGAPLCGALAFGLTWAVTDWGLLQFDAWRNRDMVEAELHASITALREDLEAQLLAHWEFVVEQQHAEMRQSVERTFIPARELAMPDRRRG